MVRVGQQAEGGLAGGFGISPRHGFQNAFMLWNEHVGFRIVGGGELEHVGEGCLNHDSKGREEHIVGGRQKRQVKPHIGGHGIQAGLGLAHVARRPR